VIHAYQAGRHALVADAAADMWALGIIAFGMLTKARAFGDGVEAHDMIQLGLGAAALARDDAGGPGAAEGAEGLEAISAVMPESERRESTEVKLLLQIWNHMFDSTRTSMFTHMNCSSGGPANA
jgi:hypothetical protein